MKPGPITFRSFDEERTWVEERRRKRKERPSKFDIVGTGTGALLVGNGTSTSTSVEPQQTRHARRLYVGNLPPRVTEEQIHTAFNNAIRDTIVMGEQQQQDAFYNPKEDPILTVYINFERYVLSS